MKIILNLLILILCFTAATQAQQKITTTDFKDHYGKTITLCDTVYSFKIVSDTLTLINMGGNYPNQKFIVAIKGNKVTLDWVNLKRKHLCVTGVMELYKNMPEIVAFEPNQVKVD